MTSERIVRLAGPLIPFDSVTGAKEPSKKAAVNKVAYEMCCLLGLL